MKTVMIIYNQEITDEVFEILEILDIRGFTKWNEVQGRGTNEGEPRMGTHTWPALNGVLMCVIPDEKSDALFNKLEKLNASNKEQGLKAYEWNIERALEG